MNKRSCSTVNFFFQKLSKPGNWRDLRACLAFLLNPNSRTKFCERIAVIRQIYVIKLHVNGLHTQEEVLHILKGRFKFQAGDETTICEKGDFAYIPAGTPHAFINLSDEPGESIAVFTPGGTNKFFEEFGPMMNADGGPPEQEVVAALMEKHGMTLLGPPLTED